MSSPRRALLLALLLVPTVIPAAAAAPLAAPGAAALARTRLDPRLTGALVAGSPAVPVWVEFVDKGETGPADLAARLAEAERALTPENRRRRERAHVKPLVDWLDLPLEPSYVQALEALGLEVYGASRWFNHVAVRTSGQELQAVAALPFVRIVRPVDLAAPRLPLPRPATEITPPAHVGRAPQPSGATAFDDGRSLGQLTRLGLAELHEAGYIGTFINVAVLDNGFNYYRKHESLRTIPVGGGSHYDFIRDTPDVQDTSLTEASFFEHGTATLSVVAGRAPGRFMGAAPGCNAILARTEEEASEKPIEMTWWAAGAEWAESLGADILTASLSYRFFPDSAGNDITYPQLDGHTTIVTRAAEIAAAKGVLVVVSAGNDGSNPAYGRKISAPADANGDSVLTIAAVDSFGVRAAFSSKGPTADGRIKPDLAAQGTSVWAASALGDPNTYQLVDGTSFSTPLVAGLAACLMQARPTWTPVQVIQALKATATQAAAPDTLLGWGIPNGPAALQYVPDTLGIPPGTPLSLHFAGRNPFRAGERATITLSLGSASPASGYRVRVLDAAGRVVRVLGSGRLAPGSRLSIPWSGDDRDGRTLVPGLYFLDLDGAGHHRTVRIVVLR